MRESQTAKFLAKQHDLWFLERKVCNHVFWIILQICYLMSRMVIQSSRSPAEDDDLVSVTLNGLGKEYAQFRTSISVREKFPDFEVLIALLISEEKWWCIFFRRNFKRNCLLLKCRKSRGRGRGGRFGGRGRNQNMQQTQEN